MDPASGQALALRRWTNWVCSVFWTPTVAPAVLSLYFFSLLRLPPSVRPPLFTHIYYSVFFSLSSDEPCTIIWSRHDLTSCYTHCRTQAYILLLHYSSMRIYVFSLYIYTCIHTITTTSFAYIYIWTHCHTRAHTLLLYVYSYIYTHYTYII